MKEKHLNCISCGKCTENCIFLKKYGLDFSREEELKKLAYHCMLCGKCTRVCPINVDGRAKILEMRCDKVSESKGKLQGYYALRFEKNNYKFKNYRRGKKKSVLFPGCNYPSLFPRTMDKIIGIMQEYELGVIFDCCGKPIGEMGLKKEEQTIIEKLNCRFKENEIEEIIVLCPNCYYYLKERIQIPIVSIYEKLLELGIDGKIGDSKNDFSVFLPCPDRESKQILSSMYPFFDGKVQTVQGIQCCGLGGSAFAKEKSYPEILAKELASYKEKMQCENIYVYCASCAGSFKRNKISGVQHVLSRILRTEETANTGLSFLNRVKCIWK